MVEYVGFIPASPCWSPISSAQSGVGHDSAKGVDGWDIPNSSYPLVLEDICSCRGESKASSRLSLPPARPTAQVEVSEEPSVHLHQSL